MVICGGDKNFGMGTLFKDFDNQEKLSTKRVDIGVSREYKRVI